MESLIRICFLLEGRYAPYSKWLGRAFRDLKSSHELAEQIHNALFAAEPRARERALGECCLKTATLQNESGLTEPQPVRLSRPYSTRPGAVINAQTFADACLRGVKDAGLRSSPL